MPLKAGGKSDPRQGRDGRGSLSGSRVRSPLGAGSGGGDCEHLPADLSIRRRTTTRSTTTTTSHVCLNRGKFPKNHHPSMPLFTRFSISQKTTSPPVHRCQILSSSVLLRLPLLSTRYPAPIGLGALRPAPQPLSHALPALIGRLGVNDLWRRRARADFCHRQTPVQMTIAPARSDRMRCTGATLYYVRERRATKTSSWIGIPITLLTAELAENCATRRARANKRPSPRPLPLHSLTTSRS